jgi:O-antigen/teichoic acid export membrane protein
MHRLPRLVRERIECMPLGQRLVRGAFWSVAGTGAAKLLNIPVAVVLARLMGASHYGELGVILGSVDLFAVFAGFGLGMTATKHVAEFRHNNPERAGRILGLSTVTAVGMALIFAAVLFIVAPTLASHTLSAPYLAKPLRLTAMLLFFGSLSGAQTGALYGFEAFRTTASLQAIAGALSSIFMMLGYFVNGLNGIIWGLAIVRLVEWVLRHVALRAEARRAMIAIRFRECTRELSILWQFSLPAVLGGALVTPINWLCATILVRQWNGYREMGLYNAASQWSNTLLFLPVTVGIVVLPILSDCISAKDIGQSANMLRTMLLANAAIVTPLVVLFSVLSPYIMRMYGREYSHAWLTLVLVTVTAGVLAVLMPVGDLIAASGRMWVGLFMNLGWAVVLLASTAFLVHRGFGAAGLAAARLFAYLIHAAWTSIFAYHVIRNRARQVISEKCAS